MTLKTTESLFQEGILPLELKGHIRETCEYCGVFIVMNEKLTLRRCFNNSCPGHLAQKADRMFKYLGVKGIGPETARSYIQSYKVQSHLDLVPIIFKDQKPKLYLFEIAQLLQIDGEKGSLEKVLKTYKSFSDYYTKDNSYIPLRGWENILYRAETYFEIKDPLPANTYEVMITGNLDGYTKADFINICNHIMKGKMHVKMVGLKNSASVCISEDKNSSTQKAQLARGELRRGIKIPILTSQEFILILRMAMRDLLDIESKKDVLEDKETKDVSENI